MLESNGKIIIFMDSDGATDLDAVWKSFDDLRKGNWDMLCGVRERQYCKRSRLRAVTSLLFSTCAKMFGGTTISDTQCGFKVFTRRFAQNIFNKNHLKGWAFDIELVYLAGAQNMQVSWEPVLWTEKAGSKLSIGRDSLVMLVDMCLMRLMYATGVWKV